MMNQETLRIMARHYYAEYRKNGGDIDVAMRVTLDEFSVPDIIRGTVAEEIRNYHSETVISLPRKTVFSIRRRLGHVRKTFTEMSLPNGDRD